MHIIEVRNVNHAWAAAVDLIEKIGEPEPSRVGSVLVAPHPVMTIYHRPRERVLFDPVRDANPFFHLHEALWMLAGRNDAVWLDQFVSTFSERFAESGGEMHGAYGFRWRQHFAWDNDEVIDQLDEVVDILKKDPSSRQAVIQMWDCFADLGVTGLKDRPCNTQIYLRVVKGALDLSITCRSNDIVWGAYGANAVHFSILQEYLAARIGVGVGKLYQYSWNWHMYDSAQNLVDTESALAWAGEYPANRVDLVTNPDTFDDEVAAYTENPDDAEDFENTFFKTVALPMFRANEARREKNYEIALIHAEEIKAQDWREACVAWIKRRIK